MGDVPGLGEPSDGGYREVGRSDSFGECRRADGNVSHFVNVDCHGLWQCRGRLHLS